MRELTRTRRSRVEIGFFAAVLAIVLLAANPLGATNVGSAGTPGTAGTTNGVWYTPDAAWKVAKRDLTSTYSTGVTNAIAQSYNPTDLSVTVVTAATCTNLTPHFHDVCVFDSDYGNNGVNGWNQCAGVTTGSHPNQVCSLQYVKINTRYSPPATRVACHELGHSVGLRHTNANDSCMKSSADGGSASVLTSHDKSHLNARY